MSTPTGPDDPTPGAHEVVVEEERDAEDRRALIAVGVVIAVVAIGLVVWWLLSGDDEEDATSTNTTTTEESTTTSVVTTTTEARTTTTTTVATVPSNTLSPEELATVVFPYGDSSRRFSDPVAAAGAFATELVGFTEPVLGGFAQGDARSGEVPVSAQPDGPVTTVLVRQYGPDDSWWVIGASTPDIVIEAPAPGAEVTSPMQLRGRAVAFEGNVEVHLHRDGELAPIATGFVTGGALGEPQPFQGELPFERPDRAWGALVLRTTSAQDGRVVMATAQRVAFPTG